MGFLDFLLLSAGSREAALQSELRRLKDLVRELHIGFDAEAAHIYAKCRAAYGSVRADADRLRQALEESRAESRVQLHHERERVFALEEALARADQQLAERAVAGSFTIGEPAPDELVVAADEVADAVRGVARALKAAAETLAGSKKGASEFWALAIGHDMLREYVAQQRVACSEAEAEVACRLRPWLEGVVSEAALPDKFCSSTYALPLSCFAEPKEERRQFGDFAYQLRQLPAQSEEAVGGPEVQVVRNQTSYELARLWCTWLRHPNIAGPGHDVIAHDGVRAALNRLAIKCVIFHALSHATRAPVELIRCVSFLCFWRRKLPRP